MPPIVRFHSIDILRGLVMIIMALDHTRDFFHVTALAANPLDPATTSIPLYFTRWVTHFCAPVFVFLSGLSVYISSQNKPAHSSNVFLRKRGLWLILAEVVIVTLGITFNPFYNEIILQVIWAIGCSMVLLSFFKPSYKATLITGLILVLGHNITDLIQLPQEGVAGALIQIFLTAFGSVIPLSESRVIFALYAVLPWTGIMFLGYAVGAWYKDGVSAHKRRRYLVSAGTALIALFIILRLVNRYGDPAPWKNFDSVLRSTFSFLNASKYPPSLMYTCMTLGPALLLLAMIENWRGRVANALMVYGRVPFFYYVLHFYLLHALLVAVFFATGHTAAQIASPSSPFLFRPAEFGYGLPMVYLIWIAVVLALYLPCRWFWKYKRSNTYWLLRYV